MAEQLGVGVRRVPVDKDGRLDLEGMAAGRELGGPRLLLQPEQPDEHASTPRRRWPSSWPASRKESPDTAILIDEAYHDYVTDPAYATAVPLALEHPNVIVTRTLSKAYGMAGMRVGYAVGQPRTIESFNRWAITFNQNTLAVAAAIAVPRRPRPHRGRARAQHARRARSRPAFFSDLGCRVMDSQTNFVFVETGPPGRRSSRRPAPSAALMVGREFPPLEKTHARVSIGTIEEMQRASPVIGRGLCAATGRRGATHVSGGQR